MPLESDDRRRPTKGVVVTLIDEGDGTFRLVMDDVTSPTPTRETSWTFDSFYTNTRLEAGAAEAMQLPDADYQGIGVSLMARLLALSGRRYLDAI